MKTPQEWLEINRERGAQTQPAATLRLFHEIQRDALESAIDTLPGGSYCDPQKAADDIRELMHHERPFPN